ncbi:hypothetical protein QN277_017979 [Acacia crassicarpa]|uniref:Integrase catalytic domain-containing protein n=1 Tax=Acacia crassicarpa TaxID=499986 RepID=A0AAE1JQJ7_9FABA|nr:hypothetical protein QN277_017979 [Acacia crassicarpa]
MENQFNTKIKALQCDMGSEYKPFTLIANSHGIQMRYTCPYTSQQNGRAERKHRHIVETGLTLLAQAQMPLHYSLEAFQTATYLINRMPMLVLHDSTPLFQLYHTELDYSSLQPFGCACYPCLKPYSNHKFSFHSQQCVFLGYSSQEKGFKCLSSSGCLYLSRHVVFDPLVFPFATGFLHRKQVFDDGATVPLIINSSDFNSISPLVSAVNPAHASSPRSVPPEPPLTSSPHLVSDSSSQSIEHNTEHSDASLSSTGLPSVPAVNAHPWSFGLKVGYKSPNTHLLGF